MFKDSKEKKLIEAEFAMAAKASINLLTFQLTQKDTLPFD